MLGIALVVFVFVLLQSLAAGIEKSSAKTGDPRNLLVVRKGATAESASLISRQTLTDIRYFEEIARNEKDEPIISADVLVLANLPRRNDGGEANVLLRGVTARGMELRPQVKLAAGRWFEPGKREIVVSAKLAKRFANFDIGDSFKTGSATFTVVGWLEGGGSAFDSECWLDADECRSTFERDLYSSFLIRPKDEAAAEKGFDRQPAFRGAQIAARGNMAFGHDRQRVAGFVIIRSQRR